VRELLEGKVTLDVEGIDRLYLNLYQPMLQTGAGVATFFKQHRGAKVASTALMGPMSHAFVKSIHDFARREGIEIVSFAKGQRKDEITKLENGPGSKKSPQKSAAQAQSSFRWIRITSKGQRKPNHHHGKIPGAAISRRLARRFRGCGSQDPTTTRTACQSAHIRASFPHDPCSRWMGRGLRRSSQERPGSCVLAGDRASARAASRRCRGPRLPYPAGSEPPAHR
jgi:hypothetical protein